MGKSLDAIREIFMGYIHTFKNESLVIEVGHTSIHFESMGEKHFFPRNKWKIGGEMAIRSSFKSKRPRSFPLLTTTELM